MLKTRIILIIACVAIVWLLFLLPKVVVENSGQMTASAGPEGAGDPHTTAPAALRQSIDSIKAQYLAAPGNEKSAIFADSLASLYKEAGQFDSAAWFAGKAASFFKDKESLIKAGNRYYDAYTFALDPKKQNEMGEMARDFLGKVLEAEPSNLEAKVKIAMTYLGTQNPMQGITMLREVLEEDPTNELAMFNMGMLAIQSGQYERAVERLSKLVSLYPNHVQGQLLLGVAYLNTNQKEKAREQFERVKKLDDDPAVQAAADSYLQDLK
ncbi:MAG: tetratricopeptide repeat protein [Cyclobacteriaceae bacterium]|mgnify:FL=1|nr:tetratricopeptide repeat protein [Cyclobacteriaceae bacterium]MCB9237677.1 tetratricopeptide repeat protein [Flammeovirgaceae bacterium]MCB0498809.1 tetratricopeptide repeat protein [Cyclobacteriaceae bacterium]MCO5270221.1 tetratricopeptide repeat protein [Cyclobacteriaceae bacterium]MCW5903800.1 tetratricopeptide repeat protein [Cyclobacteriaceae bacterium]